MRKNCAQAAHWMWERSGKIMMLLTITSELLQAAVCNYRQLPGGFAQDLRRTIHTLSAVIATVRVELYPLSTRPIISNDKL